MSTELYILGVIFVFALAYVLGLYAGENKGRADVYEFMSQTDAEREEEEREKVK